MQEFGSEADPGASVVALVKWYDPERGFGFLTPADGSRDAFCHASVVGRAGWDTLPEGAAVTCEVEQGRQVRRSGESTPSISGPHHPPARQEASGGWVWDVAPSPASGHRLPDAASWHR